MIGDGVPIDPWDLEDPFDLVTIRLAIVHSMLRGGGLLRRAEARQQGPLWPERARRGQLLWLQADGSRTTAHGGSGRRR